MWHHDATLERYRLSHKPKLGTGEVGEVGRGGRAGGRKGGVERGRLAEMERERERVMD